MIWPISYGSYYMEYKIHIDISMNSLRTINNLYIMNLSAADFCIGLGRFYSRNFDKPNSWEKLGRVKNHKSLYEFFHSVFIIWRMEIWKLYMR